MHLCSETLGAFRWQLSATWQPVAKRIFLLPQGDSLYVMNVTCQTVCAPMAPRGVFVVQHHAAPVAPQGATTPEGDTRRPGLEPLAATPGGGPGDHGHPFSSDSHRTITTHPGAKRCRRPTNDTLPPMTGAWRCSFARSPVGVGPLCGHPGRMVPPP